MAEIKRNSWGGVRKLPSGRFQARYRVEGRWFSAPTTFRTKHEADAFLAATRTAVDRGSWVDPNDGSISLNEYAIKWLKERPCLRPRTIELYEGLLRLHVLPMLGNTSLAKLQHNFERGMPG